MYCNQIFSGVTPARQQTRRAIYSSSTGFAHGFPVHANIRTQLAARTTITALEAPRISVIRSVTRRVTNTDSAVNRKSAVKDDLPDTPPPVSPMDSIVDALDDITGQYRKLDEHFDKEYIEAVVSLRDVLLEYEWRQHGKMLAERKGVAMFEQHCAENDIDVEFDCITKLYSNPHDMSVLPSNKLKLRARSIIQQTVDERYASCYAECSQLARELAKTGLTDMIPEKAGKVAGAVKDLLPLPAFLKKLF